MDTIASNHLRETKGDISTNFVTPSQSAGILQYILCPGTFLWVFPPVPQIFWQERILNSPWLNLTNCNLTYYANKLKPNETNQVLSLCYFLTPSVNTVCTSVPGLHPMSLTDKQNCLIHEPLFGSNKHYLNLICAGFPWTPSGTTAAQPPSCGS